MDRLDEISLSRIATILDKHTIIRTDNNSIWERIISNAGQSVLYEEFRSSLTPYTYNGVTQIQMSYLMNFIQRLKVS